MHPHRRFTRVAALIVGGAVVAGCGSGGGGQLAQGETSSTSAGAPAEVRAVPASRLPAPDSPAATARELNVVETELRADDLDTSSVRRLGRRQQQAYRALAAHPGWLPRVLARTSGRVRAAVEANAAAGAALASLTPTGSDAPDRLPDWQILAPEPAAALRSFYDEAERSTGVPWAYLAAIHLVETRMGRIRGPSSAGAQGPMQFIPATWADYGDGDIQSNHDAIQAAGRYLASRGAPTDMDRALFSYNNDDRYVAAVKAYASVLLADPRTYAGYYQWQVFYATRDGAVLLPEGWRGP